jgi:SAM-dependent methyltransferase
MGTITRRLVDRYPDLTLVALEPADNVFADLSAYAALNPRVTALQTTLADYQPEPGERFDAILYLNVLEHIDDDAEELRLAAAALRPGGAVLVFGPAMERLYSELDYRAGHYRRYASTSSGSWRRPSTWSCFAAATSTSCGCCRISWSISCSDAARSAAPACGATTGPGAA